MLVYYVYNGPSVHQFVDKFLQLENGKIPSENEDVYRVMPNIQITVDKEQELNENHYCSNKGINITNNLLLQKLP